MSKPTWSKTVKHVRMAMKKHSPEILIGIGIAGMITTTVIAVKATPKAIRLIEQAESEKSLMLEQGSESLDGRLTAVEMIQTTWKCYVPAAVTGVMSVACLIGANSVNVRRNAALATAYAFSESALKDYQEKVVKTIGEKKEQSVRDAISKDKIDQNPVSRNEITVINNGGTLCYDAISGRYFKSDIEKLKRTENELNRRMLDEMNISLNDFYYEVGLGNIGIGDDLGWHVDDGLITLCFSSQLTDDGTPCVVIDYHIAPRYDFYKNYSLRQSFK